MLPIARSNLVWVKFVAGALTGGSLPFQDQPDLNGNLVTGVELVNATLLALTPDQTAVTTSPQNYSLTLNEGSDARYKDLAGGTLYTFNNAGVWKEFEPFYCDFQKSRTTYRAAAALAADEAVAYQFYYMRPEDVKALNDLMDRLRLG